MTDRPTREDFPTGFFNSTWNKFKNISPTIEDLRRFTLHVEVNDEYQKYLTSRNREKLPIDNSDNFVTPLPKQIKELVPQKKVPVSNLLIMTLHKQLKSFMEYVADKFKEVFELINSKVCRKAPVVVKTIMIL
ncbi:uncharacterized protein [Nicotiana tomentosiformis]|uniref:uncharacterized protein n=1 Tax=Nicotiana tomentosiformis TaxID=4098 RepID=UPI00388CECC0